MKQLRFTFFIALILGLAAPKTEAAEDHSTSSTVAQSIECTDQLQLMPSESPADTLKAVEVLMQYTAWDDTTLGGNSHPGTGYLKIVFKDRENQKLGSVKCGNENGEAVSSMNSGQAQIYCAYENAGYAVDPARIQSVAVYPEDKLSIQIQSLNITLGDLDYKISSPTSMCLYTEETGIQPGETTSMYTDDKANNQVTTYNFDCEKEGFGYATADSGIKFNLYEINQ